MIALQNKLFDATLRIDKVIVLAGALSDPDSPCGELDEFIDYEGDTETLQRLFPNIPRRILNEDGDALVELVCEWLSESGSLGYLVQFATPVMKRITKTAWSFSWGSFYTRWEYAETFEAVVEKGLAWAAEMRAKEKKKGGAA